MSVVQSLVNANALVNVKVNFAVLQFVVHLACMSVYLLSVVLTLQSCRGRCVYVVC